MNADALVATTRITPGTPAARGASWLLQGQLAAWRILLPAVLAGEDPEALHQLRVCGRRLVAVLSVLEAAQVPQARPLRRRIGKLLRRCGPARDLDVQIAVLESAFSADTLPVLLGFLRILRWRRIAAQLNLLRLFESTDTHTLFVALDGLGAQPPREQGTRALGSVARDLARRGQRQVNRAARRLDEAFSLGQCHALRIETRKLRYLAELLESLSGMPLTDDLRRLQRLQSLLGRINDARHLIPAFEIAASRLQGRSSASALRVMRRVVERQRKLLQDARGKLRAARVAVEWDTRRWNKPRARL